MQRSFFLLLFFCICGPQKAMMVAGSFFHHKSLDLDSSGPQWPQLIPFAHLDPNPSIRSNVLTLFNQNPFFPPSKPQHLTLSPPDDPSPLTQLHTQQRQAKKYSPQKKFCWHGVTVLKRLLDAIAASGCSKPHFCSSVVSVTLDTS